MGSRARNPALAVVPSFPVWERDERQWGFSGEAGALIDQDARELLAFLDLGFDQRMGHPGPWAYNGLTDALGRPPAGPAGS